MIKFDDLLLFRDHRADGPVGHCGVCGREIYAEGSPCHYCARFFP